MTSASAHRKSATVVGDVMGKYHPHSNDAIYDAMVRMGQDFSLRYPLIDPQGNFGTPDDGAAAMRYTEARLSPLASYLLQDIREDTVDFTSNYSASSTSRRFFRPGSRTCWRTAVRELPSVWPRTWHPTTSARLSTG